MEKKKTYNEENTNNIKINNLNIENDNVQIKNPNSPNSNNKKLNNNNNNITKSKSNTTNALPAFRSLSFHNSDPNHSTELKRSARTKSFLRDSKIIELTEPSTLSSTTNTNKNNNYNSNNYNSNSKSQNKAKKGLFSTYFYSDPEDANSIIFESKYNFIEKYLTLQNYGLSANTVSDLEADDSQAPLASTNPTQNQQAKAKPKIPEIFRFDFQVQVRCYNMKGDQFNIWNFVTYKLDGFYDNREFNVERRYKEFILYRKYLSNNWPGILIPPIPPKKAFGNMEEGFIKLRIKYLQNFFNKIASAPHLAAADETRIFLDPASVNFLEIKPEKFDKSFNSINNFYSEYFCFLQNCELNAQQKKSIESFLSLVKRAKETLENFLLITTEAQNNKLEIDMEIESLYENLYELDNNYVYEIYKVDKERRIELNKDVVECGITENMYRTKFPDFFNCFFEWANVELIETDAMIEAISSVNRVKENYERKLAIFKAEEAYLIKVSNPAWFKKILFSPDYELIKQQTDKVELLRREKDALANLLELTLKVLYYMEIPLFKSERVEFYRKFLRSLYTCDLHESDKMQTIYKLLMSHCMNVLKLYNENRVFEKDDRNFGGESDSNEKGRR